MNRLPAKQIYLLFIIIVGIIALSVYSTYALFTFETETSDIVSIHIPKSLKISENIYEYQQITLKPNSVSTTDVDIQNSFDYDVCYSVWYKIIGDETVQKNIQIFEQTESTLTSSGVMTSNTSLRVTLAIINDNDKEVKINLGTIGTNKNYGACSLNITSDKNTITTSYKNIEVLTTSLIENTKETENEENYLVYTNEKEVITLISSDKVFASNNFTYNNELFSLTNPEYITFQELVDKNRLLEEDIYFCKEKETCQILYKITLDNIKIDNNKYYINKYNKLIGYSAGTSGLKKINNTDYVYYGDNPNNFIYYNCSNNDDLSTCELWRIVGFFYNKEKEEYNTKIVKNTSIGKYQYDYKMVDNKNESSNNWNNSTLYKYLNEEYKIINNNDIYIETYKQNIEIIPSLEVDVKNLETEEPINTSKVKILSLSDYIYASSCNNKKLNEYTDKCLTNNWLNNIEIEKEWTYTGKEVEIKEIEEPPVEILPEETEPNIENSDNEEIEHEEEINEEELEEIIEEDPYVINYIYTIGKNILETDINDTLDVRPVVYLKGRILLLDGIGSLEKPYVIK